MMLTGKSLTYVTMDRGVVDVALVKEIKEIEQMLGMGESLSTLEFYARFPHLRELRQGLENEIDANEAT